MKIVTGTSAFGTTSNRAEELVKNKGIALVKNPYGRRMTEDEIKTFLKNEKAVGLLAGLEPLNERVFSECPDLKAIARVGVGMDNIDLKAAEEYGIKISNTPDAPSEAVAEMTLAALLSIEHRIIECNKDMHIGVWKKRNGYTLKGRKIFIIGYGRIGQKVAELFSFLGANISVYDPFWESVDTKAVELVAKLEEGLGSAEIISIHAAGGNEILGKKEFEQMKRGVVILNSARGNMINEDALFDALSNGVVSYFWGDVFNEEPYAGKLAKFENAILTPHISTASSPCRELMEVEAVNNLLEDLKYV